MADLPAAADPRTLAPAGASDATLMAGFPDFETALGDEQAFVSSLLEDGEGGAEAAAGGDGARLSFPRLGSDLRGDGAGGGR